MKTDVEVEKSYALLGLAFLFSGAAGLIYQVAWQRILFSSLGLDLVSVSIIVSTFMLGLGCGALLGGHIADRWPQRRLWMFCFCEIIVGIFGLASPHLLRIISEWALHSSVGVSAITNFLLVLPPTVFMGATLPILISHLSLYKRNTGINTGYLYSINSLGAMLGTLATSFWLLNFLELDLVIYIAALLNISIGISVVIYLRPKH